MTDIPDDIMKTAHATYLSMLGRSVNRSVEILASSVLAERERCAEVARSYAVPALDPDGNVCGYYGPGPKIAAAIMKGTKP